MKKHLILGGAGAGKTTRLLQIMEQEINSGIDPKEIAFVSFTRKAAQEAQERVEEKFGLKKLPYFRTLHSLASRELRLRSSMMMSNEHYREVSGILKINITGKQLKETDLELGDEDGDRMLFLYGYSKVKKQSLEETYHERGFGVDWFKLKRVADTLENYKESLGILDFNDVLKVYAENCEPLPIKVAIIDEAQDLSPLQWDMVERMTEICERIYYAGDDDQAIYNWAGADVRRFLHLDVDEREVLPVSYRLPRSIFKLASKVSHRIQDRYEKNWRSRDDAGEVKRAVKTEHIDFSGNWLILSRNLRHLKAVEQVIQHKGIPFESRWGNSVKPDHLKLILLWQDALKGSKMANKDLAKLQRATPYPLQISPWKGDERKFSRVQAPESLWYNALEGIPPRARQYYQNILRQGYSLTDEPLIRLDTIHASKGGEADNVLLILDMSRKPYDAMMQGGIYADDEHRVFYVGVTRARQRLVILQPQTSRSYRI